MRRRFAVLAMLVFGCSAFPEAPRCDESQPCAADSVCVEGLCILAPDGERPSVGDENLIDLGLVDSSPISRDAAASIDLALEDARLADASVPDGRPVDSEVVPVVDAAVDAAEDAAPIGADPCNGEDDDDDGNTDEDFVPEARCRPPGTGIGCPGVQVCRRADGVACELPSPLPVEVCNGADDDCDGVVDDITGTPCFEVPDAPTNGVGVCVTGLTVCTEGALRCGGEGRPSDELCNNLDDDCDSLVDEAPVDICGECVVPGGEGACRRGVRVCSAGGRPVCVPTPRDRPEDARCDLVDDDCDGHSDEFNELDTAPLADERASAQCPDARIAWPQRGRCEDPTEVGCDVPHACMDPACLDACRGELRAATARCIDAAGAEVAPSPERDAGATTCARTAEQVADECFAACPASVPNAARFTCGEAVEGPSCVATACAPGYEFRGERCVRVEVCNNGVDEDADGLVDGTLRPWNNPCEAILRPGSNGELGLRGYCSDADVLAGLPGCEDTPRLAPNGPVDPVTCQGADCPVRVQLDYDYAMDREEVSNRAFKACVDSGCCSEPSGARWRLASSELNAAPGGRVVPDDDRCPSETYVDFSGTFDPPALADQPVVGVSWCQARDYCAWAGKRLLTEYEWERAALGPAENRRRFPWGDQVGSECPESNCCRAADVSPDALPAPCRPENTPVCPEGTVEPGQVRYWCPATYELTSAECTPLGQAAGSPGPSVAWANQDGATPEGAVNLGGNVSEWVNDWYVEDFAAVARDNPIGPGCSTDLSANFKTARGSTFTAAAGTLDGGRRFPFPPYARLSSVGLRCGRSLEEADVDEVCDPGISGTGPGCGVAGRDACAAPNLSDPRDSATCPAGRRLHPGTCFEGVPTFCESEAAADCTRLDIDTFSLNPDSILGRLRPLALLGLQVPDGFGVLQGESGLTDAIQADLVTNGGDTALYLDVPCDVGLDRQSPVRLVQGSIGADGALVETGVPNAVGDACVATQVGTFIVSTQFGDTQVESTCNLTEGGFLLRGFSMDLRYSRVILHNTRRTSLRGRFELNGSMVLVTTLADAQRSRAGPPNDEGIVPFIDAAGIEPLDLCFFQAMVPYLERASAVSLTEDWLCNDFLNWPGCSEENLCVGVETDGVVDRSMCRGYIFPFDFHAAEPIVGTVGKENCACP